MQFVKVILVIIHKYNLQTRVTIQVQAIQTICDTQTQAMQTKFVTQNHAKQIQENNLQNQEQGAQVQQFLCQFEQEL